jgi:hypothetical protein
VDLGARLQTLAGAHVTEFHDQIVESFIEVPGLRPGDNLQDRLPEIVHAIRERPWLKDFWRDIRAGKRSAVVVVALGGVFMVTAVGAEFEFGVRRGRDIREFAQLLKQARRLVRRGAGR